MLQDANVVTDYSIEQGYADSVTHHKVVALVPAYNEAQTIELTVHSLMAQTYPFEYVLIIANNCTDDTVAIIQKLQLKYTQNELRLLVMPENKHKKSGALNYGLTHVGDDIDFLFGMDGDTIVDTRMVEEAIKQFEIEPNTGGICSAYRTFPLRKDATHWQRFLWRLQNIEFTLANAWRVENYKSARVLPGVSVMFRMKALKEVAALDLIRDNLQYEEISQHGKRIFKNRLLAKVLNNKRRQRAFMNKLIRKTSKSALRIFSERRLEVGYLEGLLETHDKPVVWATNSLVEDYRLTLDLKDIGWEVKSSLSMISWSDVPLKLRGKGGLWDQRQRWYSGTVDEIRLRRFREHSRYEIFTISLLMINLLMRLMLASAYLILIINGVPIQLASLFLVLPVMASVTQLYRLRGGDQLDKWQKIFTATLVVNEIYAFYRELIYANSIRVSFAHPNREW